MKTRFALIWPLLALCALCACSSKVDNNNSTVSNNTDTQTMTATPDTASARVKVETNLGSFTVLLYGDTPQHRDNFLKLAKENYYNGTLFHRVIKGFMVQAGDPNSRNAAPGAALGSGGPDYKLDAEIVFPKHFHKRGALAAARQGDQVNPLRQSSGSQFYVVTGEVVPEAGLANIENHLRQSRMQKVFNELAMQHRDNIISMQRAGDRSGLQALQDSLIAQAEAAVAAQNIGLTAEMRQAYTTIGGTPHLDGDYTVFGEVLEGMETIEKIESAETGRNDRPKQDVKIIKMEVL